MKCQLVCAVLSHVCPCHTAWTKKKTHISIVGGPRSRDLLQLCDKSNRAAMQERGFCLKGKKERKAFNIFLNQTVQSNGRWKTCQLHKGTALTLASLPNMHFVIGCQNFHCPEMFELSQSVGSSRIIRLRNQNVPRAHETKCKMRRRCSQMHSFYVTSISPS